jgi:hypothetical protein
METFPCPVTWETQAGTVTHQHHCELPADHVHKLLEIRLGTNGGQRPVPVNHRCHCSAWQPVRDADPVL